MDMPRSRFPTELIKIIEDVADSHFIAFDLEFSGVARHRKPQDRGKLTLQQLYDDIREAALKYQILQVGFTVVKEDVEKGMCSNCTGCYIARPYNFNISPLPALKERHFERVWSSASGAIEFLTKNGFQFDLPITQGIYYLSRQEEETARQAWIRDDNKRNEIPNMETKEADLPLVQHIRDSISKWQAQSVEEQSPYLNIPAESRPKHVPGLLNRYQMRLTHQIVRSDYPKLKTTGMRDFIQVTNPTEEQQASEKLIQSQYRERDIAKAVGFRWLMEAILGSELSSLPDEYLLSVDTSRTRPKDGETPVKAYLRELQDRLRTRRKVLVGHNCFTDLVNLYCCFIGDPPESVVEFADRIHDLFPAVVDTKFLASYGKKYNDTGLEQVEYGLRTRVSPKIEISGEFDRYENNESAHEAGYDSLLTANVAIRLSAKLSRERNFVDEEKTTPLSVSFGENDGYETAAENLTDTESSTSNMTGAVTHALTAPLTAVKGLFGLDDSPASQASRKEAEKETSLGKDADDSPSNIAAIRQKPMDWLKPKEVKKSKSSFATSNVYEALEQSSNGSSDPAEDSSQDLMSFSSEKEKQPRQKTFEKEQDDVEKAALDKKLSKMITKGEMMPRWDDENGFWQFFGNRLQVNGSQERECRLH